MPHLSDILLLLIWGSLESHSRVIYSSVGIVEYKGPAYTKRPVAVLVVEVSQPGMSS